MARVLVIEDNPVNMKLAVHLLDSAGHAVLRAVDAETGMTLARAELPDLILMDFQLPGMDGMAATALLKQDAATAAIPVIALTAVAMNTDLARKRAAGCDAYLAKPLRYQELYAAIDLLLPGGARQAFGISGAFHPGDAQERSGLGSASSPDTHGGATPAVDVGILESLVGSDPAVIFEFLDTFRISTARIAPELKAACTDHQALLAGRHAHKLKSSSHAVGALALGGLCAAMETAGKAGSTETLLSLLPRFELELAAVNTFLNSLLATDTLGNAAEKLSGPM